MTVTPAGPGGGDYVQETAFKYVGAGVGDFALVSDPPPPPEDCVSQIIPSSLTYDSLRSSLESTFMLRLAALAIVFLLALIITWALWPTPAVEPTPKPHVDPRDLPRDQCVQAAIAAALSDAETIAPHHRFGVKLDHSNWARFGFLLEPENRALYVGGVDGGLLENWNDDHPGHMVRKGDYVVEVNSISGSTRKMLQEFNQPTVVRLTILRPACALGGGGGGDDVVTTSRTAASTSSAEKAQWECYSWTAEEKAMLQSWSADEQDICTTDRNDGYQYVYTHGDEAVAEGCGRCWCCRRHSDGKPEKPLKEMSLLFRPGFKGYEGFMARELHSDSTVGETDVLSVEATEEGKRTQVLLRFDDIIGEGVEQIHPGARVRSAALNINVINPGHGVEVHKVLTQWDPATTYQEFGGDGATPGKETVAKPLSSAEMVQMGLLSLDMTSVVQAWARGEPNFGVALLPRGADGLSFMGYPSGTPPALTVEVLQEPGGKSPRSTTTILFEPPQTTVSVRDSATTTTTALPPVFVTSTAKPAQSTYDPHGLDAEFFFGVDPSHRTFEAATQGRQADAREKVADVNYVAGSPRWEIVEAHAPFAARWRGELTIDGEGRYSFQVLTDNIMSLTIDGKTLLGGASGAATSPLFSSRAAAVDLAAGAHTVVVTLLQHSEHNLMAIDLRYQGPDTEGKMVSVPKAALFPGSSSAVRGVAFALAHVRLQRKFLVEGVVDRGGIVAGLAAAIVAVGALVALLPTLQLATEPFRRAWRTRAQRRQLRRYDPARLLHGRADFA